MKKLKKQKRKLDLLIALFIGTAQIKSKKKKKLVGVHHKSDKSRSRKIVTQFLTHGSE